MKIKVDNDLELRLISLASAQTIFNSINHSRQHLREWLPFVSATKTISDTRNFIKSVLQSQNQKPEKIFEIWQKTDFAGLIGFKEIDQNNHKAEMGYWLDQRMTEQGIMLKATKTLIDHAFQKMELNRIVIKVATGNLRSLAIPKKLGFSFEGLEREGEFLNSQYHNLEVFGLLKKEWK